MSRPFEPRRLWLLIRGDLLADYRTFLTTAAAVTGVMLLGSMYTIVQVGAIDIYYIVWYAGFLSVWMPFVASTSFRDLHDKAKNEAYLLLPASALEKVAARLLRATIGQFALLLILLTVASAAIEGINSLVFGQHNTMFDPLALWVWRPLPWALVGISLFFLGAAWFRKNHFFKTALALTVLPAPFVVFTVIVVRLLLGDLLESASISMPEGNFYAYYVQHRGMFRFLGSMCEALYFVVLPVFCWSVAWLRVTEAQVSDGV